MIVYCAAPIRGDKNYQKFADEIIEYITSLNHTALSELNPDFKASIPLTDDRIFTRDMKWLNRSNVLIAEVSGPSLGVGYEIAYAIYHLKIPVLALAHESAPKVSSMIAGCSSDLLSYLLYSDSDQLKKFIFDFLSQHEK